MSGKLTAHGHDPHCGLCALRVYGLWVAEEPPPLGCSDGLDATPWRCGHVLNAVAMSVIRTDYLNGELQPHHEHIRHLIGPERFAEISAHVRAHKKPPKAGKRIEPDYNRTVQ
jgi:hypothetical protein